MKRNDKIQQIFDDYAQNLPDRSDLADRARSVMSQNAQAQHNRAVFSSKPSNKRSGWIWAVCSVCVVLAVCLALFPVILNGNFYDGNELQYYTSRQISGKALSASQTAQYLPVERLGGNGWTVVYDKYYGYFADDGDLRYIVADLGVRAEEGGFVEMTLIAEKNGYLCRSFAENYNSTIRNGIVSSYTRTDDRRKGEYLTSAFFKLDDYHYYVSAMTGADSSLAEQFIEQLTKNLK